MDPSAFKMYYRKIPNSHERPKMYEMLRPYTIALDTITLETGLKPENLHPSEKIDWYFIKLPPSSELTVKTGYRWDGPTGPTAHVGNFMRGSLVHDALYDLMRLGLLDYKKARDDADRLLQSICIKDGMKKPVAWIVYQAVRLAGEDYVKPRPPHLIFGSTYETLARAIHEDYVRNEREKGNTPDTNPSMVPWEELPESLKESNRGQAEHIRVKLEAIGCDIAITTDWDTPLFQFSSEEVELLAKMEHERWVEERLRGGWKPGPVKNIEKKISDTLVPWDALSEENKDKDRITVEGIPAFLAKARFQVYQLMKREWHGL